MGVKHSLHVPDATADAQNTHQTRSLLSPPLDEKVDLNDSKWEDIHVTTGALKMFFRELPEPLFSYGSFNDFVNAISE